MKLLAVIVLASACGTVSHFTPTNPAPRPLAPRPIEEVQLFTTGTPERPYVEIGIVTAAPKGGLSSATDGDVLAQLRREGASHGCDGVVVNGSSTSYWRTDFQAYAQTAFRAACIVYTP